MAGFSKLRPFFQRQATTDVTDTKTESSHDDETAATNGLGDGEKRQPNEGVAAPASILSSHGPSDDRPTEGAQQGVQDIEAITLTWSRSAMIMVYINMWFLYLVHGFASDIQGSLNPYVTSVWADHSILTVVNVVANAATAATYIPMSKIMDVWGRADGFLLMTAVSTLGLVLMAVSTNLPTYCAANVFYTVGLGGQTYCVDVITADSSKLKNRGLAYAFTSSPYIITAFAGPAAAQAFYDHVSWQWGFGSFAIILPIMSMPMYYILKTALRNAKKDGLETKVETGRTIGQKALFYFLEFDLTGVVVFSVGLTVFLIPFIIADSAPNGWATGYIIAMIVIGLVMLFIFVAHEYYIAPAPMLKFAFLTNRTVLGACLLDATYQIAYYCWNSYFTSFLQVVNDVSITSAGQIDNIFDIVSGVLLLFVGVLISRTGRFKWLLYIAVPLYIFSQGLMIYFRKPNQAVGYLIMCQVFISVGGSVFIIIEQLAILAAVDHQHVASVLALLNVVGTVGGAMGSTICGSIWTNTFGPYLQAHLPADAMSNYDLIYEDLTTQLSYEVGSPTRIVIQQAYGYGQTRMLAVGTGIMALALIWMMMMENLDLKSLKQVKGVLF
ncbi:Hypothetical protein R9X50_00348800 [Acrodontium crateriforme]|uniref:Major facilitator superfamily (MFS) profile domain-containing protein n=1 Tax=Acrodontium crateriforme TaxID=150365 RepID=A0AAQ3RBW2_9PEZI|nr:Hypothetical protein R9X50_00348800 [Acrodontium crateriforme]